MTTLHDLALGPMKCGSGSLELRFESGRTERKALARIHSSIHHRAKRTSTMILFGGPRRPLLAATLRQLRRGPKKALVVSIARRCDSHPALSSK
jgi:hypothetical protein